MKYDYLVAGAGLFGAVFAYEAKKAGKKCLVIDRRQHIAGNIYTEDNDGIQVHKYGAHIFHTSDKKIWDYVNQFSEFNNYINSPVAVYNDELYNLPFNMNTFSKMWGIKTPAEAQKIIEEQISGLGIEEPQNLEEQALKLVGRDVYEKLIKGYTQKQWGRECKELPAFIIKRLPLRFTYDNNYFNDRYQGIPEDGYTAIVEKMLDGIETRLDTDYFSIKDSVDADKVIYTGMIDEYYGYKLGVLEYRSVRFETERLECSNYQGNAVINYTSADVPYTRIIEHKHFNYGTQPFTIISKEYSSEWNKGSEPYYPINNEKNNSLYGQYRDLAEKEKNVIFGGRLGAYKYYDMDKVIAAALGLPLLINGFPVSIHFLIVILVITINNIFPPFFIVKIPLYSLFNTLIKWCFWKPAKPVVYFGRVYCISPVMPGPVCYMCYKVFTFAKCFNNCLYNFHISLFIMPAYIINFTSCTLTYYKVYCNTVVFYIEPVTHIFACPVYRYRPVI